jgi:hypothetical protein
MSPVRVRTHTRRRHTEPVKHFHEQHQSGHRYYIKGVDSSRGSDAVASGTLYASSKEAARDEFRRMYPGYDIVQVNEQEV